MAGLGKKTFEANEVLTAADVNGYLMDQSVMRFATTSARDTNIPSPTEGMVVYIDADDSLLVYNGSAWVSITDGITITASQISDVTATATELNFVDGVTSDIQTQIDSKADNLATLEFSNSSATIDNTFLSKTVVQLSGSDQTFTIDPGITVGGRIDFINAGSGVLTFAEGSGVTIDSADGALTISKQYNAATILVLDTDSYILIGGLA